MHLNLTFQKGYKNANILSLVTWSSYNHCNTSTSHISTKQSHRNVLLISTINTVQGHVGFHMKTSNEQIFTFVLFWHHFVYTCFGYIQNMPVLNCVSFVRSQTGLMTTHQSVVKHVRLQTHVRLYYYYSCSSVTIPSTY